MKAVDELTNNLKLYDSNDPIKYDFAIFGMGIEEAQNHNIYNNTNLNIFRQTNL